MANPTAYTRKRVVFFEKRQRFLIVALVDQGDIALDADMGRAGGLTGGCAPFFNCKSTRYGLGILLKCRLAR